VVDAVALGLTGAAAIFGKGVPDVGGLESGSRPQVEDTKMLDRLFVRRADRGQGLVEYALIIALVAVVVIATLILLGPQIKNIFQNISNNL